MKYLLKNIAYAILLFTAFNCTTEPVDNSQQEFIESVAQEAMFSEQESSDDCNGESPKVRIANNGTINVNLEIYDENGSLVDSEHGISTNYVSDWKLLPVGEITFAVSNINADKIVVLDVQTCMNFELDIDSDNNLTYSVNGGL